MFDFSAIKGYLFAGLVVLVVGALIILAVVAHNRATEIEGLNSKLSKVSMELKDTASTANNNAARADELAQRLEKTETVLEAREQKVVALETNVAKLEGDVAHAKNATCYPPAIVSMVIGLRDLYTRDHPGDQSGRPDGKGSSRSAQPAAVSTAAVDKAIASWLGELYAHDQLCMQSLAAISNL